MDDLNYEIFNYFNIVRSYMLLCLLIFFLSLIYLLNFHFLPTFIYHLISFLNSYYNFNILYIFINKLIKNLYKTYQIFNYNYFISLKGKLGEENTNYFNLKFFSSINNYYL